MNRTAGYSPAYPAALLVHGMTFVFAALHFLSITWPSGMAATFYAALFAWVLVLVWHERSTLISVGWFDLFFMVFFLLVLASLLFKPGPAVGTDKFARYLPFMVAIPYLCGRLLRGSDIARLVLVILCAGILMLPLALLDHIFWPGRIGPRWPFFGQDHGPLLIGAILTSTMIAACVYRQDERRKNWAAGEIARYALLSVLSGFLVWVAARGWLLAALAGIVVLILTAFNHKRRLWAYVSYLVVVLVTASLSLAFLPRPTGQFYVGLLNAPLSVSGPEHPVVTLPSAGGGSGQAGQYPSTVQPDLPNGPLLGKASCKPIEEGKSSVAIRLVFYQEAMAMFERFPLLGVGAARFGAWSCAGIQGFPHSTVMQGFAELGLLGGGMFAGLLSVSLWVLARRFVLEPRRQASATNSFIVPWFIALILADQIYGNYFMSLGTYLMLGLAARTIAERGAVHAANIDKASVPEQLVRF